MNNDNTIYTDIFEGDSEEAKVKFPFLVEGLHLKVLRSFSRNIGVFPKENSFYVVTFRSLSDSKHHAVIEETNSIDILNIIVKRETYQDYYLDNEQLSKVKEFLHSNNCNSILD